MHHQEGWKNSPFQFSRIYTNKNQSFFVQKIIFAGVQLFEPVVGDKYRSASEPQG